MNRPFSSWNVVDRREATVMVLYLAVVLLAVLTILPTEQGEQGLTVAAAIWATVIGLATAHWFAFRVANKLFATGRLDRETIGSVKAQLVAALAVALVTTVPIVVVPDRMAINVSAGILSLIIAAIGYALGRRRGRGRFRAVVTSLAILAGGWGCVLVKAALGH
jgi:nucleoside permease NupC